jgi:hypothetical protein
MAKRKNMAKDVTPGPLAPSLFVLPIYTAAIFLSAVLLFAIQPMFTKMVLPRLYSGMHFV